MSKSSGKKVTWQRVVLICVCVVLLMILALVVCARIYLNNMFGNINRVDPENHYTLSQEDAHRLEQEDTKAPDETLPPETPTINEQDIKWDDTPQTVIGDDENIVNILLIGQDRRPGEGRARSDSMILCTFNKKEGTLTMTSFMRDMYVQIPGYQDTRINVAYALGGMKLLNETLLLNFGVHVDANVEVDFSGFEQVVDMLGGVDLYLTSAEAAYLNNRGGEGLTEGVNHLDGKTALSYSRIRYLDSDFVRTNRQRNVLESMISAYKGLSLDRMLSITNRLLPLVTTDMTNQEITGYVTQLFPMLSGCTVQTQRIPVDDGYYYASIRGMSVLVPNLEKNRQFLIDTLSPGAME